MQTVIRAGACIVLFGATAMLAWLIIGFSDQALPQHFEARDAAHHNHSPSYQGLDYSLLKNSSNVSSSILTACDRENDGDFVKAFGYDSQTGKTYTVRASYSEGCDANHTGHHLEWHQAREEAGTTWLYGDVSYH